MTRHHDMTEDITQETFLRTWLKRDLLSDPAMQVQPRLVRHHRYSSPELP
jgi:DNA-directed RNA polymerase specialized sigma24 family protein